MAHGEEVKRVLRNAYVHQGLTLEAAAENAGVGITTAARWKRRDKAAGDNWDAARSASRMAGEGRAAIVGPLIEGFILQFQAVMEQIKKDPQMDASAKAALLARLSDAFHKTMHAAAEASPELSRLAIASEVLQLLSKFVVDKYPQHGIAFTEILEPFGLELARLYG